MMMILGNAFVGAIAGGIFLATLNLGRKTK